MCVRKFIPTVAIIWSLNLDTFWPFNLKPTAPVTNGLQLEQLGAVADLGGGGDGGDASPHQRKHNVHMNNT